MVELNRDEALSARRLALMPAVVDQIYKTRPIFLCSYPLNDRSLVERLSVPVHHETASAAHVACMAGVLYFLFKEFAALQTPIGQEPELQEFIHHFEGTIDHGLKQSDVLCVPSFGNILALTLGFMKIQSYTNTNPNPLLSTTLISAAASHCLTLCYNHDSAHGNSSNSRRLFWSVYMLERQHSFFLGRNSCMPDHDIDTAYPPLSSRNGIASWDDMFIQGVKLARLQGRVYELWAVGADRLDDGTLFQESESEREKRINGLVAKMQSWFELFIMRGYEGVKNPSQFRLCREIWEIKYYSAMTTLLRTSSTRPSSFSSSTTGQMHLKPDCFKVARLALYRFLRCWTHLQEIGCGIWGDVTCDLLTSLLTPFIVITLHAIASSSTEETTLLEDIVASLQTIKTISNSSAITRIHRICSLFAKVAKGLVQGRRTSVGPGWKYSRQTDLLEFPTEKRNSTMSERSGAGHPASSVFGFGSDNGPGTETGSLFNQVMDTDVLKFVSEGEAQELFGLLEKWMGGLLSGVDVFGGFDGVAS